MKINKARKDVENPSWFKFKHKLFTDSDFYDFSHSEIVAWVYILCEASAQNKHGIVHLNAEHAQRNAKLSADVVLSVLKKLKSFGILNYETSRRRHADVTAAGVRQEEIRLDKSKNCSFGDERMTSFLEKCEALYQEKYPRKLGKSKGLKICKIQIKNAADFSQLEIAINHYASYVKRDCVDIKFVKHFSTFMGEWRDWLDASLQNMIDPKSKILSKEDLDKIIMGGATSGK